MLSTMLHLDHSVRFAHNFFCDRKMCTGIVARLSPDDEIEADREVWTAPALGGRWGFSVYNLYFCLCARSIIRMVCDLACIYC